VLLVAVTLARVLGDKHPISVLAWTHTKLMLECKPSTSRSHSKKQRLLACLLLLTDKH
jgi:hypothetical protein